MNHRNVRALSLLILAGSLIAAYNGSTTGSPSFGTAHFSNGLTSTTDSNYLTVPSGVFAFGASDSWTVEAWVSNTAASATQVFASSGQSTNNVWFGIKNGRFYASVNGSGAFASGAALDSGISINDGSFHHVAAVMSGGSSMTLFVDGTQGSTYTGAIAAPTATNGQIGRFGGTGFAWGGKIDELVVWTAAKYTSGFTPASSPYNGTESGQRALYHLEADATDSHTVGSAIAPNDSGVLYSPFNWSVSSGAAQTVNAGAYLRTIFSGTSVEVSTDTSMDASPYPQLVARVDNGAWSTLTLADGSPTLTVASGLDNRKHLLEVLVKSTTETQARWTNPATLVSITGFILDSGASLSAPTRRAKNVLVYGDSITEGVRAHTGTATNDTDKNDARGSWIYGVSQQVDAEVGVVGFGGQGVTVGGSGSVPALTSAYGSLWNGVARDFSTYPPDLVIYNQGTNDSGSITTGLTTVANAILSAAPSSLHLFLVPFNGTHASEITAAATAIGASASVLSTSGFFTTSDSSDGLHPYDYAGVGLIAPRIAPAVLGLVR